MFKQKKLKSLLKNNPPLVEILRSDLCNCFVKGFAKGKKESVTCVTEKFVFEVLDCVIARDVQADSGHLCHYASAILQSGNTALMDFFLSDKKYLEYMFKCLEPERSKGHYLCYNAFEVPNSLHYFSQILRSLFEYNPQKIYQFITPPLQELLIYSAYFSSQMANVIVQIVSFKIPIVWLEQFLNNLFTCFAAKPVEVISLFLYLSKVISSGSDQVKLKFVDLLTDNLFNLVIDMVQYPETSVIAHHVYNSLTYYCGLKAGLVELFFSCTNKRGAFFGSLLVSKSAKVALTALMIVQSHVANGNYEILSLVFVNLMDSLFAYENRCVFHLEVLNTLTYLWFPKNNISSERLPMLKRKFVEYNIVEKIEGYINNPTNKLQPLKPYFLKLLQMIPRDDWTPDFERTIKALQFTPDMPSWKLKKKLEQHRLLLQSDSNRAIALVDRVETALLASKSEAESESAATETAASGSSPKTKGKEPKGKKMDKKALEAERVAKEKAEQERLAKEKLDRERAERDRLDRERLEKERAEKDRLEREKERLEREKAERDRIEKERIEKEKAEKEKLEQERLRRVSGGADNETGVNPEATADNDTHKPNLKISIDVERVDGDNHKRRVSKERDKITNSSDGHSTDSTEDEKKLSLLNYRKYHRRNSHGQPGGLVTSSTGVNGEQLSVSSDTALKNLKTHKHRNSSHRTTSTDSAMTNSNDEKSKSSSRRARSQSQEAPESLNKPREKHPPSVSVFSKVGPRTKRLSSSNLSAQPNEEGAVVAVTPNDSQSQVLEEKV